MYKLDLTSGLEPKPLSAIKYLIKTAIGQKLPFFPDDVEMMLFMEGRGAWSYSWRLLNKIEPNSRSPISIAVEVTLKKEFLRYQPRARHLFRCKAWLQPEMDRPKVSVREIMI